MNFTTKNTFIRTEVIIDTNMNNYFYTDSNKKSSSQIFMKMNLNNISNNYDLRNYSYINSKDLHKPKNINFKSRTYLLNF